MLHIHAIPAFNDNYIWLIQHQNVTVCVDPGDAKPVLDYLQQQGLRLTDIWLTHHHHDHIGGVAALKVAFPECVVYGSEAFADVTQAVGQNDEFALGDIPVGVWHTPGHTDTHLSYIVDAPDAIRVFCGDTLFSAGCGRVFTGTIAELFDSLQRYLQLPSNTLFYPAHEYTAANLRFAHHIEPENADIKAALKAASATPTLPVSLAHEKQINPFLRTVLPQVQKRIKALAHLSDSADELAVFAALRELKNHFAS